MSVATNRYLSGSYAPVADELTAFDLPVTGTIPAALRGRYLRNGPNPVTPPDPATYHWFTGTGMVHGIRLADGRAEWYRNRWVRNAAVADALGEPEPAGDVHGGMDGANTNVIGVAGRTFALVEAGARPVELSAELETIRRSDFDGTLPNGFTAHPKVDPVSGELFATAYHWALPGLQYLTLDPAGHVRRCETISVPGGPMVHDMSITATRAVLYDLPVIFNLDDAMAGGLFPYSWDDGYGARIGVLPREGSDADVRWFEIEPCYVFHPLNAYDDTSGGGDRVVLDVVRYDRMFDRNRLGPNDGAPALWRWTVDLVAGTVHEVQLDDRAVEFPRVDERVVGRPHRFGFTASLRSGQELDFDGTVLVKYDLERGTTEVHDFGAGHAAGEAVFVPSRPDAAEDDGWVMSLVHDPTTDRSDLVILAAQDFTGDPVATVHLPQRVPSGFHGNWIPDPA